MNNCKKKNHLAFIVIFRKSPKCIVIVSDSTENKMQNAKRSNLQKIKQMFYKSKVNGKMDRIIQSKMFIKMIYILIFTLAIFNITYGLNNFETISVQ